jgi:predicted amidohydrolase
MGQKLAGTLIGVAQLDNCTDWDKNYKRAKRIISKMSKHNVDLVCFQEAYLSGYHVDIFSKDYSSMPILLNKIREHAYNKNICVYFPTIEKLKKKYLSAVYIFNSDDGDSICYKEGLTPGEKTVMKPKKGKRSFKVNGIKFGSLICREMEDPAYTYYKKSSLPDIILWPSYWGWKYHMKWSPLRKEDGKKDKCYQLVKQLKRPLIQINMSRTIRKDMSTERYGKSVFVDAQNKKVGVGSFGEEELIIVSYNDGVIKKKDSIPL